MNRGIPHTTKPIHKTDMRNNTENYKAVCTQFDIPKLLDILICEILTLGIVII